MQNPSIRKVLLTALTAGALAGCETTSTTTEEPGEEIEGEVPGPSAVTAVRVGAATNEDGMGSNGLRLADGTMLDLEGTLLPGSQRDIEVDMTPTALTLTGAVLRHSSDGGYTEAEFANMEFTLYPVVDEEGPRGRTTYDLIVTADVNGETALFNLGDAGLACDEGPVMSSYGNNYCFDFYPVGDVLGEDSDLVLMVGYPAFESGDDSSYFAAWIGLEANPDLLAYKAQTFYGGGYMLSLGSDAFEGLETIGGEMQMMADFANGEVEGQMYADDGMAYFEGLIEGNGFSAAVMDVDSDFLGEGLQLVGDIAEIDGVFYCVTGQEAAGTIVVDTEVLTEDGTFDVNGAGVLLLQEYEYYGIE
jgi:hypothetical protein